MTDENYLEKRRGQGRWQVEMTGVEGSRFGREAASARSVAAEVL